MNTEGSFQPVFYADDLSGGWFKHVSLLATRRDLVREPYRLSGPMLPGFLRFLDFCLKLRAGGGHRTVCLYFATSYFKDNVLALASSLLGFRYVTRISGKELRTKSVPLKRFRTLALRRAEAVIVLQREDAALASSLWGVAEERAYCIPNAVPDVGAIKPEERYRCSEDQFNWLFCGVVSPAKRLDIIIRALQMVNSRIESGFHRLTVVGGVRGKDREWFDALLERLSVSPDLESRVSFVGEFEQCGEFYSCASGYVFCAETGGMSNAVLEALSAGLPVVMSKGSMSDEIFSSDPHAGMLVDPSPADVADAMIAISTSEDTYHDIAGRGRKLWEKDYSPIRLFSDIEQLLSKVFEGQR